jgi:uncharacterized protein (TIGR03435 family)
MTLDDFSKWMYLVVDRLVLDKTGIPGTFDYRLQFTLTEGMIGYRADDSSDMAPMFPTVFEALQQQAGLKLVSAKGPGNFLVIDHVERPSGN